MATVRSFPPHQPPPLAPGATPPRATPGVVIGIDGPERLGPEQAGALTLLHVTFADDDKAQRGYQEFGALKEHFVKRPGFIRWLTFNDGVDTYTLGLWRSVDDVMDFVRSDAHRRAAKLQNEEPFEYSQFAGVWERHTATARTLYCDRCGAKNPAPAAACSRCGDGLDDTFQRDPAIGPRA
jgi:hypothetical protein